MSGMSFTSEYLDARDSLRLGCALTEGAKRLLVMPGDPKSAANSFPEKHKTRGHGTWGSGGADGTRTHDPLLAKLPGRCSRPAETPSPQLKGSGDRTPSSSAERRKEGCTVRLGGDDRPVVED